MEELAAEARNKRRRIPSSQGQSGMGRGARQPMSSIENSRTPLFSSRSTVMNGTRTQWRSAPPFVLHYHNSCPISVMSLLPETSGWARRRHAPIGRFAQLPLLSTSTRSSSLLVSIPSLLVLSIWEHLDPSMHPMNTFLQKHIFSVLFFSMSGVAMARLDMRVRMIVFCWICRLIDVSFCLLFNADFRPIAKFNQ